MDGPERPDGRQPGQPGGRDERPRDKPPGRRKRSAEGAASGENRGMLGRGQQLRGGMREQRMRRGPPPPPIPWWTRVAERRAEVRMEEIYWDMTIWKYENFAPWELEKDDDEDDKDEVNKVIN